MEQSYQRRAAVCNSVRETIREVFSLSGLALNPEISNIPSIDTILRATNRFSHIDDGRLLKEAVIEHILSELPLADEQKALLLSRT
jgi:hypothetical protein